ncbi:MAG: non-ribosomal peptide synthetase [Chloroflexota bacterium]
MREQTMIQHPETDQTDSQKTETADLQGLASSLSPERLALLARRLQKQNKGQAPARASAPDAALPRIVPDPARSEAPFPLTDVQQAYWIGRSGAFELGNIAAYGYLEFESGDLDVARFNRALQRLIDRHGMLRAIVLPDGTQQILDHLPPYHIETLDLRGKDSTYANEQLTAIRQRMANQILPSDRWPLFEFRATLLDGGRVRMHISMDGLLADAWSTQILFQELYQFYRIPDIALPKLEISFRDYVVTAKAIQETPAYRRSLNYWFGRVPELPAAPDLPLARDPATIREPRFKRRQSQLDAVTWKRLRTRIARAGLTPSIVMLSAFAEVLTAWSKNPLFTLNITLFNRLPLHPQVNHLVGDFTSLFLLAVDHRQPGSFAARTRRLMKQLWLDLDHRFVSGVQVLRELARRQTNQTGAIMPVVFTSTLSMDANQKASEAAQRDDAHIPWLENITFNSAQTPQVWLDNQIYEADGALVFLWDAVEDLFPAGMLDEMFAVYGNLLHELADSETIWQVPLPALVPEKQLQQRRAINATAAPVSDSLMHTLFAEQAVRNPAGIAVIASGATLTYGELAGRSHRLAHWLRAQGVRPNQLVAIVMEKGWEQVVAALGILQSGAAYLPIDPNLPPERRQYLLQQGECALALTQSWLDEALEWPQGLLRASVDRGDAWAGLEAEALEPRQQPGDLAYVIYTSGSTGKPKGVMIDHRGAVNTILDVNRRFAVGPQDRVLALSALNFDLSVYDIFGLLAAGGTIVVPDAGAQRDPRHWAELIARHGVTLWNTVPALMEMLAEYLAGHSESGADSLRGAANLRLVMMSGDWIPVTLPHRIRRFAPQARLISLGGATEASIWSILYPIEQVDPAWKSIPYGKPMINQQFHVLDRAMQPCPTWVPGDLYIGGIGLALGYWRDTQKTDERFITHPGTGERLYKTGDLGRYLPDGNIEFLGREDFQVKIQGHRIELGEIEAALLQHPDIQAAVAAADGNERGNRRLVAYVVAQPAAAVSATALQGWLAAKLPAYMVPAAFRFLDALPLSANGKVDRQALPRLERAVAQAAENRTEESAESGITQRLTRLVADVLKLETLDPHADLLQLGANSVDLVRISNVFEETLQFRPPFNEIYQNPSVAGLAQLYLSHQAAAPNAAGTAEGKPQWAQVKLLLDPDDRRVFKAQQWGLRRDVEDRPGTVLDVPEVDESVWAQYRTRRSHRQFSPALIPAADFGRLLSSLRQLALDGQPKYLYGSAGGAYPVQTYLHLKAGRVEGLAPGTYYYHPVQHQLITLTPAVALDRNIHSPFVNQPIFDTAAFSIFLVAQMSAIAPLYGERSLHYAAVEAGLMAQQLELTAPTCRLGLCQIGDLEFEPLRALLALDESHVLIHSLLGGRIDERVTQVDVAPEAYRPPAAESDDRENFSL